MTYALIYSRMDSSRFPQKATAVIGGHSLVEYPILALKKVENIEPILCTSDREIDNPLEEIAEKHQIKVFRGDAFNVAKRTYNCLDIFSSPYFLRVNGDSPVVIPELIREGLRYIHKGYDLITNLSPRSFPYGVSLELINSETYKNQRELFENDPVFSEHITSYYYRSLDKFKVKNISNEEGDWSKWELAVDYPEDISKIEKEFDSLENLKFADLSQKYNRIKATCL